MGTRASRLAAWTAVRGKPSRMNDAEERPAPPPDVVLDEGSLPDVAAGVVSHPLDESSCEISSSIVESGTSSPAWIAASTLRPV